MTKAGVLTSTVILGLCLAFPTTALSAGAATAPTPRHPSAGAHRGGPNSAGLGLPPLVLGRLVSDSAPVRTYDAPCKDLVLVGARGSGEDFATGHGLGAPIDAFRRQLVAALNRTVLPVDVAFGYIPVGYPAQPTDSLWTGQADAFFDGLAEGVRQTLEWLQERHAGCPSERYVLAGYSQGAMVMHRLVWVLAQDEHAAVRRAVVGGVAIADGDRWHGQGGRHFGTRTSTSWLDRGVAMIADSGPWFDGAHRARLPEWIETEWSSVCDSGDIVCDPLRALHLDRADIPAHLTPAAVIRWVLRKKKLAEAAVQVHTSHYQPGPGATQAAKVVARIVRKHLPNPITTTHLPRPVAGVPYSAALTVSAGRTGQWSLASGSLPAGLHIDPSGAITGTASSTCSWCLVTLKLNDESTGTSYRATVPMFDSCAGLERDRGGDAVAQLAVLAINNLDASVLEDCMSAGKFNQFGAFLRDTNWFTHPLVSPDPCTLNDDDGLFTCRAQAYDGGAGYLDLLFTSGSAGYYFCGVYGRFGCPFE